MDAIYAFEERKFTKGDSDFLIILKTAHNNRKNRIHCLCTDPPPAMYVARSKDALFLKRMPGTGSSHSDQCGSFELPDGFSGLSELQDSAIQESLDGAVIQLRTDFPLTKSPGRKSPEPSGRDKSTAKTSGRTLSLRGVLHWLWDHAQFTHWSPRMEGKRNWAVVSKFLREAAAKATVKSESLGDVLYIPPTWSKENGEESATDRRRLFEKLAQVHENGSQSLGIMVGVVKEFSKAQFGWRMVLKHVPERAWFLDDDLYRRIEKRFSEQIGLQQADEKNILVVIASYQVRPTMNAQIVECALMVVDQHWLPVETRQDVELISVLINEGRRFRKAMRYESDAILPSVVLTDTPEPYPLFTGPRMEGDAREWVWQPDEPQMPALPVRR